MLKYRPHTQGYPPACLMGMFIETLPCHVKICGVGGCDLTRAGPQLWLPTLGSSNEHSLRQETAKLATAQHDGPVPAQEEAVMTTEEQILMSGGQVQTDTDHLGTGDADPLGLYTKHLEDAPVAGTVPPGVPPASPPPPVPQKADKGLELPGEADVLGRQEPLFKAKPVPEPVRDEPVVQRAAGELEIQGLRFRV